jgi:phenylalanyl-tRNA synthetase beta chain
VRVSIDWLRDFVTVDGDAERVASDLTSSGLEVEAVEPAGPPLEGVVVAEVLSVARHPNADRLSVCTVDDGRERVQVVCGAPNVAAGIKAPFARVGATLPGGKSIGAAELRGVQSNGMLCSGKELELPDDANGLLLLERDAPLGQPLADYLRLADAILEVNVTPNRGDCFSVLGIARELAARRGLPLARREPKPVRAGSKERFPVELLAGESCPRFAGRVVRGLRAGARSPLWLRERLRRAGLRAIHPVVDVTNYVMLELGQPLHAYDLDKLSGRIEARFAKAGEALVLLDGRSVDLRDDVLVIADARGPVGLAGVMGGQSTAVSAASTAIFLEGAFFAPQAVAGRARRYGLHTDASLRFERGVDPSQQARAIERATELLTEICGGECGPLVLSEREADAPRRAAVRLRRARVSALLGVEVPDRRIEQLFERLEMRAKRDSEGWRVTPPAFRFDIAIEEDLIEEVGRMIGYDEIPSTPGSALAVLGRATETRVSAERVADLLAARGYAEVVTYSFIDAGLEDAVNPGVVPVTLANPIASDMAVLRRSLWPGLIGAARQNLSHQRARFKLFEVGPQFAVEGEGVRQTAVVAGLAVGSRAPEHWEGTGPDVDFYDVKADVEALLRITGRSAEFAFVAATHPALRPGRTASIVVAGTTVGWLGALHPNLQSRLDRPQHSTAGAIAFALQLEPVFAARVPAFRSYSKFPSIRRDLAIVVDEQVSAATVSTVAREAAGEWLQQVVVFDVYRGTGVDSRRKSIGLGLILQDASRTLTDADADRTMQTVMLRLERELGAKIRTQQS